VEVNINQYHLAAGMAYPITGLAHHYVVVSEEPDESIRIYLVNNDGCSCRHVQYDTDLQSGLCEHQEAAEERKSAQEELDRMEYLAELMKDD